MKLMKKVVVVAGISLAIVGCGKNDQKTMSTSQVMSGGYLSANCASSQLNLSVSESGNSFVANGSSGCFSSETLNAFDDGAGHLTGVTLTVTIAAQQSTQTQYGSQYGYGYGSGSGIFMGFDQFGNPIYSGSGSGAGSVQGTTVTQAITCSYSGTLTKSGNYVQGQLSTSQYYQQSSSSQCPSSVSFNGVINN